MQTEWVIKTEAELPQLATAVLEKLTAIQVKSGAAAVLALHGDLGAGKTTFMQTLANSLGVSEEVTSPTFVVMKQYMLEEQNWEELVHMDAYRIEDIDELGPLRFSELLERNDVILGVEWAEHIAAALPAHTLHLTFTIEGAVRKVHIDGAD